MHRNNHGFSLIEIVVVLVLISIIAATVFTRSISVTEVNYNGQVEKILNHIRYAKALAMKRGMTNELWGINCDGNFYWLFHILDRTDVGYIINMMDTPVILPGEENEKVSFSKIGVSMDPFTVYFDKYGHALYPSPFNPLSQDLAIEVTTADAEVLTKEIVITPETGFISTQ